MSNYNSTGWVALYDRTKHPTGHVSDDVHSWDRNGAALVVNPSTGSLVTATSLPGFERLEEVARIVAAVPAAPGWRLKVWESRAADAEPPWFNPIAAWLVTGEGQLVPVSASRDAFLETFLNQPTEVYAPGQTDNDEPEDGKSATP